MDLPLYFRVLWRFRALVAAGFVLGVTLAFLSYFSVSFDGGLKLTHREDEDWQSDAVLFVTDRGFPWGQSRQRYAPGDAKKGLPAVAAGDLQRLSSLAILYAELAESDEVRLLSGGDPPRDAKLQASPIVPSNAPYGTIMPLIGISAHAATPEKAARLVNRRADAFVLFIRDQQRRAQIPETERVDVQLITRARAETAQIVGGRKKTLPIVVFLTVAIAVVGLAFLLENLRPRVRPLEQALEAPRRTA